jgi:hypothetical protein
MLDGLKPVRGSYVRTLVLAAIFTALGEAAGFLFWGTTLYPGGDIAAQLLWAAANWIITALAIGLMTGFMVIDRYEGAIAGVVSAFC